MSNDNRNELAELVRCALWEQGIALNGNLNGADRSIADAILAAGYHTTPNNDTTDPEPQFSDGPDFYAEHHAWSRRNEVGYGHNRSASVLPYPENKEHTP